MNIEDIEKLIAKHGTVTEQGLKDLIVTVVLEAVEAEREACAALCLQEAPSLDGQLIAEAIRARGKV